MPYVPDVTWSATADYYVPLSNGWAANYGAGLRWVDERAAGTTQREVIVDGDGNAVTIFTDPLVIDPYNVLDVYASFSNEHWTLRAYVKNATDEHAYSTMDAVAGLVTGPHHVAARPIQPRMFGFEVDYRF